MFCNVKYRGETEETIVSERRGEMYKNTILSDFLQSRFFSFGRFDPLSDYCI